MTVSAPAPARDRINSTLTSRHTEAAPPERSDGAAVDERSTARDGVATGLAGAASLAVLLGCPAVGPPPCPEPQARHWRPRRPPRPRCRPVPPVGRSSFAAARADDPAAP